jgi:hypothetical protein
MRRTAVSIVALLTLVPAGALSAQAITDPGDPHLVGATLIDFNAVTPGTYTTLGIGGVTFSTPNANEVMYLQSDYSGQYNTEGISIQNTYASNAFGLLRFDFLNPASAFGFNWGASDEQWTLTAYDIFGVVLATILPPITKNANNGFTGLWVNSPLIARAELSGPAYDYIFVDDFRYVSVEASVVPEPVSVVLLLTGLVGVGAVARRRRIVDGA